MKIHQKYLICFLCTILSGFALKAAEPVAGNPPVSDVQLMSPLASNSASFTVQRRCLGDQTLFTATFTTPVDSVLWNFGDAGSASNTARTNNPTHVFSSAGSFNVALYFFRSGVIDSTKQNVTVNSLPVIDLGADRLLCRGTAISLDAGTGFVHHAWSTGATTRTINVTVGGNYSVEVTDANGCKNNDMVNILYHGPVVVINDVNACEGDIITLDAGPGYTAYDWSTGANTQQIEVTTSGNYSVTVTDATTCTATDNAQVTVNPKPKIVGVLVTPATGAGDGGINVRISGGTGDKEYRLNGTRNNTTGSFSNLNSGNYLVSVHDENGCSDTLTVRVPRDNDPIVVPKMFSPNYDLLNDHLIIRNIELYPEAVIKIFDRYNRLVFESVGAYTPWDGMHNGRMIATGTYYYYIRINSDATPQTGFITIVR